MSEVKWLILAVTFVFTCLAATFSYSTTVTLFKLKQEKELYLHCLDLQRVSTHNLFCRT